MDKYAPLYLARNALSLHNEDLMQQQVWRLPRRIRESTARHRGASFAELVPPTHGQESRT